MDRIKGLLYPENKKEAKQIIKLRSTEYREVDGLKRIHPDSWVEMMMARMYLEICKN